MSVPVAAVSAMVWLPGVTVTGPVVPLWVAAAFLTVSSMWRSKVPGSLVGERCLRTSMVPVLRVLVNVQDTFAFGVTATASEVPTPVADGWPLVVQAIVVV